MQAKMQTSALMRQKLSLNGTSRATNHKVQLKGANIKGKPVKKIQQQ